VPYVSVCIEADAFHGVVERNTTVQVGQELAVANAGHGRCVNRNACRQQVHHFLDKTPLDLRLYAPVNDLEQLLPRSEQPNLERGIRPRTFAFLVGHTNASGPVNLQRANHTTDVCSTPICACRIDLAKSLHQRGATVLRGFSFTASAKGGIGWDTGYLPTLDHGVDVKRGAASQDWQETTRRDLPDSGVRQILIACQTHVAGR
jgi:hypothetical protein